MKFNTRKIDINDDFGGFNAANFCNVGAAMAGVAIVGGIMSSNASRSAASAQADAAAQAAETQAASTKDANAVQMSMFNRTQANQQPYLTAGNEGLGMLRAGMSQGGAFTTNFTPSQLNMDPSYQFRLDQGMQNLNASAAARGQLGSGQNLKDVVNYGQDAASQQYQQAFSNYLTQQNNLYSRVSGLANMGQNTAVGMATQGNAVAQQVGANTMLGASRQNDWSTSGGAASAAGMIGSANAMSGGMNTGLGVYRGYQAQQDWNNQMTLNNANNRPTDMTGFRTPTQSNPWAPGGSQYSAPQDTFLG